jgi:integrase
MGQLRQRGSVWWIRYYRNGKRYEESSHSEKKQAAIDLLKIREGDIAKGAPVTSAVARLTFDDAAKDLEREYEINGRRSLVGLRVRLKLGLTPFFSGRRMTSITMSDVRAYVLERQKAGAANATINRELAALKRMFTLARQAGKLLMAPYIAMLEERNARQGFFERDLFEEVRSHLPEAVRPVVTVGYYTGWRIQSELLTMTWAQVDFNAGVMRLEPNTTKNREGHVPA